jgi:hypothetical protein
MSHRVQLENGDTVDLLEQSDLEEYEKKLIGSLTLRFLLSLLGLVVMATFAWANIRRDVTDNTKHIEVIDTYGPRSQEPLERRLFRIEVLLGGMPDSIVARLRSPQLRQ